MLKGEKKGRTRKYEIMHMNKILNIFFQNKNLFLFWFLVFGFFGGLAGGKEFQFPSLLVLESVNSPLLKYSLFFLVFPV